MNLELLQKTIKYKYNTQAAFCHSMKWTPNKLSLLLKGKYNPRLIETQRMSELLNLSVSDYGEIFLDVKSPNGEN